jgi:hypothetical protein
LLASRRLRSRSKAKQRSSIGMDNLDGRFASISAPTVEHPSIGKLMPGRTFTSLRSELSLIRTSPRHRCPYSRNRGTPGCSFRMERNIFRAQLLLAIECARYHVSYMSGGYTAPLHGNSALLRTIGRITAHHVRRDKAALSSGCKAHPATAPAGSNRGRHGGDEMSEALG